MRVGPWSLSECFGVVISKLGIKCFFLIYGIYFTEDNFTNYIKKQREWFGTTLNCVYISLFVF